MTLRNSETRVLSTCCFREEAVAANLKRIQLLRDE